VTRFAWGSATDTGRVRQANEDSMLAVDGLFAVADGMGGHKGGEVASHLAIETLQDEFTAAGTDVLVTAVQEANRALVDRSSEDPELTGMGTTLCAMALVDADGRDAIAVVNVGDSRLYLLSEGEITQVTEDHSLVATLERQGRISRAEAAVHPQRNILTRALGIDSGVMVDSWEILPVVGDRYLICSDGLFNEVDDSRLASTMRRLADPVEAARELVRLANEAGGRDNITCVVVDVVDDSGRAPVAAGSSARITARQAAEDPPVDDVVPPGGPAAGLPAGPKSAGAAPGADARPEARPDEGSGSGSAAAVARRPRRRLFTWRVALFALAFLAVIGVAIGVIVYMGRNTYYVGVQDEQVVIFRGRPGGVLWIEPELAESTTIAVSQVPAASVEAVRAGVEESSLADAREYVANLQDQIAQTTATTTTSTTTSTVPVAPAAGLVPPPAALAPSQG